MRIFKIMTVALAFGASVAANAAEGRTLTQTAVGDSVKTAEENTVVEHKGRYQASSFSFNYLGRFSKAAAIDFDLRVNWLNIGGGYNVSGGNGWRIYAGIGQRYYFDNNVFIDGAAGLMFGHSSYEYRAYVGQETYYIFNKPYTRDKYETRKESNNAVGLYVLPRLGFATNKGWGISIGYFMCAPKMKFDGFFDDGAVMLGIFAGF